MSAVINLISADRFQISALIFAYKLLIIICLLFSFPASAHFQLNTNIRIFHIEPTTDGFRLSVRFPAALAFSEFSDNTEETQIPFLISRKNNNQIEHFLDQTVIVNELGNFRQFLASGYGLEVDGMKLPAQAIKIRISEASQQTRFTNLADVKASFEKNRLFQSNTDHALADTVIDIQAHYSGADPQGEISLYSQLKSNLPADTFVANLIVFHGDSGSQIMRITGLLQQAVIVNPSASNAIKKFVVQGVQHILSGLDHILFILCLTIATIGLKRLLWAVTGFTFGHTLTLIAGFYGYSPTGSWFIPLVEILIAASIILVAVLTLKKMMHSLNIAVTSLIGLLHGFGFSFLLGELLGHDSPRLMLSLLSFNFGIELGQLLIVTLMYSALLALAYVKPASRTIAGNSILLGSVFIAVWWVVERSLILVTVI